MTLFAAPSLQSTGRLARGHAREQDAPLPRAKAKRAVPCDDPTCGAELCKRDRMIYDRTIGSRRRAFGRVRDEHLARVQPGRVTPSNVREFSLMDVGTCQRCGAYWDIHQRQVCVCGGEVM